MPFEYNEYSSEEGSHTHTHPHPHPHPHSQAYSEDEESYALSDRVTTVVEQQHQEWDHGVAPSVASSHSGSEEDSESNGSASSRSSRSAMVTPPRNVNQSFDSSLAYMSPRSQETESTSSNNHNTNVTAVEASSKEVSFSSSAPHSQSNLQHSSSNFSSSSGFDSSTNPVQALQRGSLSQRFSFSSVSSSATGSHSSSNGRDGDGDDSTNTNTNNNHEEQGVRMVTAAALAGLATAGIATATPPTPTASPTPTATGEEQEKVEHEEFHVVRTNSTSTAASFQHDHDDHNEEVQAQAQAQVLAEPQAQTDTQPSSTPLDDASASSSSASAFSTDSSSNYNNNNNNNYPNHNNQQEDEDDDEDDDDDDEDEETNSYSSEEKVAPAATIDSRQGTDLEEDDVSSVSFHSADESSIGEEEEQQQAAAVIGKEGLHEDGDGEVEKEKEGMQVKVRAVPDNEDEEEEDAEVEEEQDFDKNKATSDSDSDSDSKSDSDSDSKNSQSNSDSDSDSYQDANNQPPPPPHPDDYHPMAATAAAMTIAQADDLHLQTPEPFQKDPSTTLVSVSSYGDQEDVSYYRNDDDDDDCETQEGDEEEEEGSYHERESRSSVEEERGMTTATAAIGTAAAVGAAGAAGAATAVALAASHGIPPPPPPPSSNAPSFPNPHDEFNQAWNNTTPAAKPYTHHTHPHPTTPNPYLQFLALLRKNLLLKLHSPLATLFEILIPILLCMILWTGHALAKIQHVPQQQYAELSVNVPGVVVPWVVGRGVCRVSQRWGLVRIANLVCPDAAATKNNNRTSPMANTRMMLDTILEQPMVIPTLGQYVRISSFLTNLLLDKRQALNLIQQSDVGRTWGNLLTLGTLHLSPRKSRVTMEFWRYLNETYPRVLLEGRGGGGKAMLKVRVHESEEEGLRFIEENLGERTWALIDTSHLDAASSSSSPAAAGGVGGGGAAFTTTTTRNNPNATLEEEWIQLHDIKYSIRMNYTTLPNTNLVTDVTQVGLDQRYQRYYLSGYLTLMKALQDFSFWRVGGVYERTGGGGGGTVIRVQDEDEEEGSVVGGVGGTDVRGDRIEGEDENKHNASLSENDQEEEEARTRQAQRQTQSTIFTTTKHHPPACEIPTQFNLWSMPMPTKSYTSNSFYVAAGYVLGIVIAFGFLFPVSRLVKSYVEEKETKMKETLSMLGVQPCAYLASWAVMAWLIFIVDAVLVTVTLAYSVLSHSSIWFVLALMVVFAGSLVSFSFFLAAFFNKAKLASWMAPMIMVASLLPRYLFWNTTQYEHVVWKMVASLLPCTALALGADILAAYEVAGVGVHAGNVRDGGYSFEVCLYMLAIDVVVYGVVGWYLDLVLPRQYGVPEKWYFFFTGKYWRGVFHNCCCCVRGGGGGADGGGGERGPRKRAIRTPIGEPQDTSTKCSACWPWKRNGLEGRRTSNMSVDRNNFEEVDANGTSPQVEILDLVKRYKRNGPNAVDALNLDLYENQITCLLGHNGAGKTTTISVLTGLFPPTSGDCILYNHPLSTHLWQARQIMGICPQHNVQFPSLTVYEHLALFERIKGVRPTKRDIKERAEEVGLRDWLYTRSDKLSGGTKRKLSVAMALCGNPRVIVLDEPTSGMDPYSRRATWDLLRRTKNGRVTLLTTHFMDEAEFLADRIAVMKTGQLQCCGSPLFLKKRFGLGYSLSVVVDGKGRSNHNSNGSNGSEGSSDSRRIVGSLELEQAGGVGRKAGSQRTDSPSSATDSYNDLENGSGSDKGSSNGSRGGGSETSSAIVARQAVRIRDFLSIYAPDVRLVRQSAKELTFRLPNASTVEFPALFEALEAAREDLDIGNYGVSNTSLEEVFLRLAEEAEGDPSKKEQEYTVTRSGTSSQSSSQESDEHDHRGNVVVAVDPETTPELEEDQPLSSPTSMDQPKREGISIKEMDSLSDGDRRYLGLFGQIFLLLKKRALVQRRDLKSTFFMLCVPAILIALVLLILMIDIPLAGPPLELSMDLYQVPGASMQSDVAVGGPPTTMSTDEHAALRADFPNSKFAVVPNASSSLEMTEYLLKSVNEGKGNAVFGAFILDDAVRLNINVDWNAVKRPFEFLTVARIIQYARTQFLRFVDWITPDDWQAQIDNANVTFKNESDGDVPDNDSGTPGSDVGNESEAVAEIGEAESRQRVRLKGEMRRLQTDVSDPKSRTELMEDMNLEQFRADIVGWMNQMPTSNTNQMGVAMQDLLPWVQQFPLLKSDTTFASYLKSTLESVQPLVANISSTLMDGNMQDVVALFPRNMNLSTLVSTFESLSEESTLESFPFYDGITSWANASKGSELFLELMEKAQSISDASFNIIGNATRVLEPVLAEMPAPVQEHLSNVESLAKENITLLEFLKTLLGEDRGEETVTQPIDAFGNETAEQSETSTATPRQRTRLKRDQRRELQLKVRNPEKLVDVIGDAFPGGLGSGQLSIEIMDWIWPLLVSNSNTTWAAVLESGRAFMEPLVGNVSAVLGEVNMQDVVALFQRNISFSEFAAKIEALPEIGTVELFPIFDGNTTLSEVFMTNDYLSQILLNGKNNSGGILSFINDLTRSLRPLLRDISSAIQELRPDMISLAQENITVREFFKKIEPLQLVLRTIGDTSFALTDLLPSGNVTYHVGINSDVSVLHNTSSPHAVAAFNHAYMQYRYKECLGDPSARFSMVNHPLPLTSDQSVEIKTVLSFFASLFILLPLCFVPAAFVVFIVKERVCKFKHVQLVSGVNLFAFWLAHYLWDLLMYAILTGIIMVIFVLYGKNTAQVFVGDSMSIACTFALIFGYGVSSLPFTYLVSRGSNNHSSAQVSILGIFFIFGFVAVNTYFIMINAERTRNIANGLQYFFRIFPPYNLGDGLVQLSISFWQREVLGADISPFDWKVTGIPLVLLYGWSFPYFTILLFLEYSRDGGSGGPLGRLLRIIRNLATRCMLRCHGVRNSRDGILHLDDGLDSENEEDEDVARERHHVKENKEELKKTAAVLASELWKVYPASKGLCGLCCGATKRCFCCCCRKNREREVSTMPKRAVRGLSTAVNRGETFGMLGMNGAGKSSVLAVLTGDVAPTSGEAYVASHDVSGKTSGGVSKARRCIGFCPQVDPLVDLMTGREALRLFGRLRGIPKGQLNVRVNELIDALTLTSHADKTTETYSGGNKRKLSLGIALIGDPAVLFIDEASSGMDPVARRKMWGLISSASENRSVLLTTHSMEEAEALCNRLTIMVNGQMKCVGNAQHLKSTYVNGYNIDLQLSSQASTAVVESIRLYIIETALPSSSLTEQYSNFLRFSVPSTASPGGVGGIFAVLEIMKATPHLMVEDYALSQCTLEQVFIQFAKNARADPKSEE